MKEVFGDSYKFDWEDDSYERMRIDEPGTKIDAMKKYVWEQLIHKLEIRRVMSIARAEQLDKELKDGKLKNGEPLPEITQENILAMLKSLATNYEQFMEQAVLEIFEMLRPRSSKYKTNTEYEIGSRVILARRVQRQYERGRFTVSYYHQAEIRALDNVFHMLDGKGATKTFFGELHDAIEASIGGVGETEYFSFKCYENTTLHLKFKRIDLVEKLNQIAGGKRLKNHKEAV